MAASIWPKQSQANPAAALSALCRWLVETAGLFTIVEAYDADGSGSPTAPRTARRRTPTAGQETDFDNSEFSTGTFGWKTNALGANDWIVLRSTNTSGNKFEVYLEYDSTTQWKYALVPLNDFTTAGGDVSPPNSADGFSATSMGSTMGGSPTLVTCTLPAGTCNYSAVADSGCFHVLADDGTAANRRWILLGKLKSSHPDDDVPFVISTLPQIVYAYTSAARWGKLSHVDHTTGIFTGWDVLPKYSTTGLLDTAGQDGLSSKWLVWPAGVHFTTASHMMTGVLPYAYWCSSEMASSGTIGSLAYVQMTSSGGGPAHLALDWDGSTAYP